MEVLKKWAKHEEILLHKSIDVSSSNVSVYSWNFYFKSFFITSDVPRAPNTERIWPNVYNVCMYKIQHIGFYQKIYKLFDWERVSFIDFFN